MPALSTNCVALKKSNLTRPYSAMAAHSMNTPGTMMANRLDRMMVLSGRLTSPAMNVMQ